MGELQNKLGERAAEGREGLREIGHTVKEAATEGIQRFKETAGERMERGKEKLMDLEHGFEDRIRQNPMKSIAIAAGVGLVLGLLCRRS
jgi:ElaB/YqjD/DUF883 family membrane-anchored ribosome-binding protein